MSKIQTPYLPKNPVETDDSILNFDRAADAPHWESLSVPALFGLPPTGASFAMADTAFAASDTISPLAASRPALAGSAASPASLAGGASAAAASGGFVVNTSFASGVSTQIQAAANATATFLQNLFSNNFTLNVKFQITTNPGGLSNAPASMVSTTFAQLTGALPGSDVLPAVDPGSGGNWTVPEAYARMLGLSTSAPTVDDTVSINLSKPWNYGQDLISGFIHEISENGMGRVGSLGVNSKWKPMDLFRYDSLGNFDKKNGTDGKATYFSADGGITLSNANLPLEGLPTETFHNNFTPGSTTPDTADSADFNNKAGTKYDVFEGAMYGTFAQMSELDLQVMQALGWTLSLKQDVFTGTGDWQTFTDWSLGAMPITVMDAAIGGASVGNATLSNDVIVNSIATKAGSALTIAGGNTLTTISGTKLNPADVSSSYSGNHGALTIESGATLDAGEGSTAVTFSNYGTLNIGSPVLVGAKIGHFTYGDDAVLTLNGGGHINLGASQLSIFSSGEISGGYKVANIDNTISGGGLISGQYLDNRAKGVIIASQAGGNELSLDATTSFTNEGALAVTDRARLTLGADGVSEKMTNTGDVFVGSDGVATGMKGDLAIRGDYTVSGAGSIQLLGDGSRIVSDGVAAATLTNQSEILAVADSQIGDAGVYASANGLSLVNSGSIYIAGSGNTLTMNTGSNRISDRGGLIEATIGGTLVIDSAVATGQLYIPPKIPLPGLTTIPPGGTIEATAGGTVDIAAAVVAGVTASGAYSAVSGQVVADSGSLIDVLAGGSIAVPAQINGATATQSGGTLALESGGAVTGEIVFAGAGGTFDDRSAAAGVYHFAGKGGTIHFASANNTAYVSATNNVAETVAGSHETVSLSAAQANVDGSSNTIIFAAGTVDTVNVSGASTGADTVKGSNGFVNVKGSQVTVIGGGDTITADAASKVTVVGTAGVADKIGASGSQITVNGAQATVTGAGNAISLLGKSTITLAGTTAKSIDTVTGSLGNITLNSAQASVTGAGNTIAMNGNSTVTLAGTTLASLDAVTGSGGHVTLNDAQASISGGSNIISANGVSTINLFATGTTSDTVTASNGFVNLNAATASIKGGNNSITTTAGSMMTLSGTANLWDAVSASGIVGITLNGAQASIKGGGNTINLNSGSSASLLDTGLAADTVNTVGQNISLTDAIATISGGSNTISADASSTATLTNTGAAADVVSASGSHVALQGAQASLTGDGDTVTMTLTNSLDVTGVNEHFEFAQSLGLQSIAGFDLSDTLNLAASHAWSDFDALLASGDLQQSNADTLIHIDDFNTITLTNVQMSSLTAAQFAFS